MLDINPWNLFVSSFFTALPIVLALVLSHIRQMAGLAENTEITKTKAEEVKETTTSVAVEAQKAVTTAQEAAKSSQQDIGEIKEKVETVAKALNGEGARAHEEGYQKGLLEGSKILTVVTANTERIGVLEGRMESYDSRMRHVEENTNAILTMMQAVHRLAPPEKTKESVRGESL